MKSLFLNSLKKMAVKITKPENNTEGIANASVSELATIENKKN